jgi:hypothetical protein
LHVEDQAGALQRFSDRVGDRWVTPEGRKRYLITAIVGGAVLVAAAAAATGGAIFSVAARAAPRLLFTANQLIFNVATKPLLQLAAAVTIGIIDPTPPGGGVDLPFADVAKEVKGALSVEQNLAKEVQVTEALAKAGAADAKAEAQAGAAGTTTLGRVWAKAGGGGGKAAGAAVGSSAKLAQSKALVDEAAKASGIQNLSNYVDKITYGGTSSFFEVAGGLRIINIGTNALRRTRAGQLAEGVHELVHAEQFAKELAQSGGTLATTWANFAAHNARSVQYAAREVEAERTAIQRVTAYLGSVSPQQTAAATGYIQFFENIVNAIVP